MSANGVRLPMLTRRARAATDVAADPVRAVTSRIVIAQCVANLLGAVDVIVLLFYVLPVPDGSHSDTAELIALAIYLPLAFALGVWWGRRSGEVTRRWLASGAPPTEADRRRVLREPLRCAGIDAALWTGAAVLFFVMNVSASLDLAGYIAQTIVMGGITVGALSYLLTERLMRPITALALADGPPVRPVGPGVKGRLLLVWAFATGVPLLGLLSVAADGLIEPKTAGDEIALATLVLGLGAFVVGLTATVLVAKSLAEPLTAMRRAARLVQEGDLDVQVRVTDGSEVGLLQSGFNSMAGGLREHAALQDLFGRHVGEEVARSALTRGGELGGEVREAAVLFVDLVGSTAMAASRPPGEVVALLNRFFAVVVDVVSGHGGWVNKFEGDAALVIFGCPAAHEDPAGGALAAARELRTRLGAELPGFAMGIGVSAGPVVAGNIGAEKRFEYTVIGDPVNEAARLCELAKTRPERVLASEAVLDRAGAGEGRWRLDDRVTLRGRREPTRLAVPA
jgi:adenylate cyclase